MGTKGLPPARTLRPAALSRQASPENLGQDNRVVVLCVVSRVHQGQGPLSRPAAESRKSRTLIAKLLDVAPAKLLEAFRLVPEPLPQARARSQLFLPGVELSALARYPTRPQPVDQHPKTIRAGHRLVRALEANIQLWLPSVATSPPPCADAAQNRSKWASRPILERSIVGHAWSMTSTDQLRALAPAKPAGPARTTAPIPGLDRESRAWIEGLSAENPERRASVAALHALLLKAARFEVNRRHAAISHLRDNDHDDLARQSADDALVAVLDKLGDFRGESRFTTWAYKFALMEAATKVRGRAWQGRQVPLEPDGWALIADQHSTPQRDAETAELLAALREAIDDDLSGHQRDVLVATTLNHVPIDVLAERLDTTRGALYKTIHDARRKLRAALAARGLGVDEYMEAPVS
jgi:RNA polymerase sigma-70 factor, ECF subfamily